MSKKYMSFDLVGTRWTLISISLQFLWSALRYGRIVIEEAEAQKVIVSKGMEIEYDE